MLRARLSSSPFWPGLLTPGAIAGCHLRSNAMEIGAHAHLVSINHGENRPSQAHVDSTAVVGVLE
jgi:hypothetical protein